MTGNLDLGINALRGTIPTEVAGLPNLLNLRLKENRLTGTVPSQLLDSGRLRTYSSCYCCYYCTYQLLYLQFYIVCFDASDTLMDSVIPQGTCRANAETIAVACMEEDDVACSCCDCWQTGSVEYCKELIL